MRKMGLTQAERKAYHRALRSSHTRTVHLAVTDLDGNVLSVLQNRLLDGQVIVDYDADVTRTATVSLLDPSHSLNFDTDSPDDAALYADRMLRIDYEIVVEDDPSGEPTRRSVRVFHGPITNLSRSDDVVEVEAQGKESLARGAIWRPLTIKKGTKKVAAIRIIMRERAGESKFSLPDLSARLPKTLSFDRWRTPWESALRIAKGMDRQLFYPGNGRLELRRLPGRPVYRFRTGTGGDVVSPMQISYTMDEVINTVVVVGGKPKGQKTTVRAQAVAEPQHPLSPKRLGRVNAQGEFVPRHLVERIEDTSIRSVKEAQTKANRILKDRLREVVSVSFDVLPVPHLDPGDLVSVETDDFTTTFRLRQFTIPLGPGSMSIGYLKKRKINRKRIRR